MYIEDICINYLDALPDLIAAPSALVAMILLLSFHYNDGKPSMHASLSIAPEKRGWGDSRTFRSLNRFRQGHELYPTHPLVLILFFSSPQALSHWRKMK